MPVCARCEGELIGILIAFIAVWFIRPPYTVMGALMLPMIVDGTIQAFTRYESTNPRRLVTGLFFGFGASMIFLMLTIGAFKLGVLIGEDIV